MLRCEITPPANLKLGDTLTLTTTPGSPALGPPALSVATANNIYGAQVGAKFDWLFVPGLRFNVVPKFMIGGNSVTNAPLGYAYNDGDGSTGYDVDFPVQITGFDRACHAASPGAQALLHCLRQRTIRDDIRHRQLTARFQRAKCHTEHPVLGW